MSFGPQNAPIRCFFQEIQEKFSAFNNGEGDVKFRLLGTVIGIADLDNEALSTVPRRLVKLDDGTALANVIITTKMITTIGLQIGSLVECIAAMTRIRPTAEVTVPQFSLVAEQVAALNDRNAETLRWMELCYDKGKSPQGEWQGFPITEISAMDLFRIIEYQCDFETIDSPSRNSQPKGISAEQLKICFELTELQVESFLAELQVRRRFERKLGSLLTLDSNLDRRAHLQEYSRKLLQIMKEPVRWWLDLSALPSIANEPPCQRSVR